MDEIFKQYGAVIAICVVFAGLTVIWFGTSSSNSMLTKIGSDVSVNAATTTVDDSSFNVYANRKLPTASTYEKAVDRAHIRRNDSRSIAYFLNITDADGYEYTDVYYNGSYHKFVKSDWSDSRGGDVEVLCITYCTNDHSSGLDAYYPPSGINTNLGTGDKIYYPDTKYFKPNISGKYIFTLKITDYMNVTNIVDISVMVDN